MKPPWGLAPRQRRALYLPTGVALPLPEPPHYFHGGLFQEVIKMPE